jgi:ubiquinone biosynthesis protein UbiJ
MLIADCLNRFISLDPNATNMLKILQGKTILFSIERIKTPLLYSLSFNHDGIEIKPGATTSIDATVAIRYPINDIALAGDIELLERVHQFIFSLNLDWEEWLSVWIGDGAAHQTGRLWESLRQKTAAFFQQFSLTISEYFSEEAKLFPTQFEIATYLAEVDELRSDVERLALKVDHLC